jgi:hypothetical protein
VWIARPSITARVASAQCPSVQSVRAPLLPTTAVANAKQTPYQAADTNLQASRGIESMRLSVTSSPGTMRSLWKTEAAERGPIFDALRNPHV